MNKTLAFIKKSVLIILTIIASGVSYIRKSFFAFTKKFPRVFAGILAFIVIITIGITSLVLTGATVAYEVRYNGSVIGCVSEPGTISSAKALATKMVCDENGVCTLQNLEYFSVVTGSSKILQANELALAILKNSKDLKKCAVITVNGQVVAVESTRKELDSIVASYLNTAALTSGASSAVLNDNVVVNEAYYPISMVATIPTLTQLLVANPTAIPIKTLITKMQTETIPFQTVETKSDSLTIGTKKVVQNGVNGVANVIIEVAYVNGVEVDKDVISTSVIAQPVNELITIGSKQETQTSANSAAANVNASFIWPVERVARSYVSAYYGDGRGHKGIDIAAPSGTKIFVVESGTVTFAGWDTSGFGYCIIIDHGNGLKTLYAHCSKINVKVGDVVGKGEIIALVGATGQATGNHLHFEVHINGNRVNPAPYIGA